MIKDESSFPLHNSDNLLVWIKTNAPKSKPPSIPCVLNIKHSICML